MKKKVIVFLLLSLSLLVTNVSASELSNYTETINNNSASYSLESGSIIYVENLSDLNIEEGKLLYRYEPLTNKFIVINKSDIELHDNLLIVDKPLDKDFVLIEGYNTYGDRTALVNGKRLATGWQPDGTYYSPYLAQGWRQINDNWYLFDNMGILQKGWVEDLTGKYYLDPITGILESSKGENLK